MASGDKNWATQYILDPLTAPQPADETGPGTHFRPEPEPAESTSTPTPAKVAVSAAEVSNGLPSPRKTPPSYRADALKDSSGHRRSTSLGERFPGDMSHRPLDQLRQEKAIADKARHVTKKHHIQPDGIDRLDGAAAGGAYHHGGPYDATLWARNNSYTSAPVNAVTSTNAETIKATPKERLSDSLEGHRPLDGVASYAPGEVDPSGHEYRYAEGENMMTDLNPPGGAYRRWPGVQYDPNDIKGKGEPSYSLEKALKKNDDAVEKGMELTDRSSPSGGSLSQALRAEDYEDEAEVRRSGSLSKRLSGGIKKRIGSLKGRSHKDE